jgi:CTP synthase
MDHKYVVRGRHGDERAGQRGSSPRALAKMLKDKGLASRRSRWRATSTSTRARSIPYRHGEVFVLDDGTECDMDLGTYERMLDQNLSRQNFITSGQIYTEILERERQGRLPRPRRADDPARHRRGEAPAARTRHAGRPGRDPADVVFVEVGGTVGDYENGFYIEAMRELAFEEGSESCASSR